MEEEHKKLTDLLHISPNTNHITKRRPRRNIKAVLNKNKESSLTLNNQFNHKKAK
jgi:hypothetical protein